VVNNGCSSRSSLQHLDSPSIGELSKRATKGEPIHPGRSRSASQKRSSHEQMQVHIMHDWLNMLLYGDGETCCKCLR
jgi:hypothetical protein